MVYYNKMNLQSKWWCLLSDPKAKFASNSGHLENPPQCISLGHCIHFWEMKSVKSNGLASCPEYLSLYDIDFHQRWFFHFWKCDTVLRHHKVVSSVTMHALMHMTKGRYCCLVFSCVVLGYVWWPRPGLGRLKKFSRPLQTQVAGISFWLRVELSSFFGQKNHPKKACQRLSLDEFLTRTFNGVNGRFFTANCCSCKLHKKGSQKCLLTYPFKMQYSLSSASILRHRRRGSYS